MRLLLTTVIRHSKVGEDITGRVIEIEWPSGRILHQFPTPDPLFPTSNRNPRGGLRGGRGVKQYRGRYYVANYDSVFVYDEHWKLENRISHPLSTDIHEIEVEEDGVWLTCSRLDLVVKLGLDGQLAQLWHVCDSPSLVKRLGIETFPLDKDQDYRKKAPEGLDQTHLNSIQIVDPGVLCLNLGRVLPNSIQRRVVLKLLRYREGESMNRLRRKLISRLQGVSDVILRLDPGHPHEFQFLARVPTLRPSHNGIVLEDGRLALAHESGFVQIIQRGRKRPDYGVEVTGNWVRGLVQIDAERLVVGLGPCGLAEIHIDQRRLGPVVHLSKNPNESVHGLTLIHE